MRNACVPRKSPIVPTSAVPADSAKRPPTTIPRGAKWAETAMERHLAESLDLLYMDLLSELRTNWQNAHQLPAWILQDPLDLVILGHWVAVVALGPVRVIQAAVRRHDGIAHPTPKDLQYGRRISNIRRSLVRIEALLYGVPEAQVHNAPARVPLRQQILLWLQPHQRVAANIPALGFMELLIRVKAQTCNSLSKSPRPQLAGCTVHWM